MAYRSKSKNLSLIQDLHELLGSHFAVDRSKTASEDSIFLPDDTCPTGMMPCDESTDACPTEDERMEPAIYNASGLRCYTSAGVKRSRTKSLSAQDKTVVKDGLRALVVETARLREMHAAIDDLLTKKRKATAEGAEPTQQPATPSQPTPRPQATATNDISEKKRKVKDQLMALVGNENIVNIFLETRTPEFWSKVNVGNVNIMDLLTSEEKEAFKETKNSVGMKEFSKAEEDTRTHNNPFPYKKVAAALLMLAAAAAGKHSLQSGRQGRDTQISLSDSSSTQLANKYDSYAQVFSNALQTIPTGTEVAPVPVDLENFIIDEEEFLKSISLPSP